MEQKAEEQKIVREKQAEILIKMKEELRGQVGNKDHWSKKFKTNPARHKYTNNVGKK